ncbi:MAG: histidine--tRNA ligase [Oscillospiraceae bacterium]|jgi:histidyl-tRNA synthetase|nr:histidine--tRNA ligase [Oscillospiraceae bacterium]
MIITNAPKGTADVLPSESYRWHAAENIAKDTAKVFGFNEIRTPSFEHTGLFLRGVGGTTDVVQKEMYTFEDKKCRSVTLKPEGTSGVVRAVLEHGLLSGRFPLPLKAFYFTPCFRYEAPDSGRLREHHQFGAEVFGTYAPNADAEVILLAKTVLQKAGIDDAELFINSIGCPKCRESYLKTLIKYYTPLVDKLCGVCRDRLHRNPMRLLDCKVDECKRLGENAPVMLDCLCDDCQTHFDGVKTLLTAFGIDYKINLRIVRGLDYYTNTVFEFIPIGGGATLCGGGRYNGLVEQIGGEPTGGVGFGMGIERLLAELERKGTPPGEPYRPSVYLVSTDSEAAIVAAKLTNEIRRLGIIAECDISGRSLKAQMKHADKIRSLHTLVVGSNEIESGKAKLKRMSDGTTMDVTLTASDITKSIII